MFNVVTAVPRILDSGTVELPWRATGVLAAFALAYWWLRGYRAGGFSVWAAPAEGLALGLIGYGSHNWLVTLGLLFTSVSFRGLYGSWKHALALTVSLFAGSLGAILLTQPERLTDFLQQTPGVVPLALFTAAVAVSTRRQEQAAARERVFSRLGSTMVTTTDREVICRRSAEAAEELLGGLPGGWVATTLRTPDAETISAIAGATPVELLVDEPADIRLRIPLQGEKCQYGSLLVGAAVPIPDDLLPSLETLAAQTVLGLRNAEHVADLRHQAFHDNLTGLANRSQFHDHLQQALARARRGSPVAILLIDLDRFKSVNDNYGHAAGDQLLVAVAQRLRDGIRGADTAARLGGDEFAVLLDGMDSPHDALLVAERLLAAIQEPVVASGVDVTPACSIGVAVWHGHPDNDALLRDADTAMYEAKTSGKGRVAHLDDHGNLRVLSGL